MRSLISYLTMNSITTKKELVEQLKNIRALEIVARDDYKLDSINFEKEEITEVFKKIKAEEDKHIFLLDEIIKILEKN